jgi:ATP-dependent exoDNAse (exonuclease V) alpha subunit
VISPTHIEGERVTTRIRERLKETGKLRGEEREFLQLKNLQWTEAQRSDSLNYHADMVIQFHQNLPGFRRGERVKVKRRNGQAVEVERENGKAAVLSLDKAARFQVYESRTIALAAGDMVRITQNGFTRDKQRLNNGDLKEVKGFTPDGDIKLANGWVVSKDYASLTHGYCVTSYMSQSKSVDCVFVAESSESFRAVDRQQFYVSASRFKQALTIYTDDKFQLLDAVSKSSARPSATDLVKGQLPEAPAQTVTDKEPVQQTRDDAAIRETLKPELIEEIQKRAARHQAWQQMQKRGRQSPGRGISL